MNPTLLTVKDNQGQVYSIPLDWIESIKPLEGKLTEWNFMSTDIVAVVRSPLNEFIMAAYSQKNLDRVDITHLSDRFGEYVLEYRPWWAQ